MKFNKKNTNHTLAIFCRLSVLWPYDFVEYKQKQLYQNKIFAVISLSLSLSRSIFQNILFINILQRRPSLAFPLPGFGGSLGFWAGWFNSRYTPAHSTEESPKVKHIQIFTHSNFFGLVWKLSKCFRSSSLC